MEGIRFLNSIDRQVNLAKITVLVSVLSSLITVGLSYYYYNKAIAKTKDLVYVMDRNGVIALANNVVTSDDQRLQYTAFVNDAIGSFYDLEPDELQIKNSLKKALYRGDFIQMQNLLKQGDFYNSLIKRKIFQKAVTDSVKFSPDFKEAIYYGKIRMKYLGSDGVKMPQKNLVLQFNLEQLTQRTDNNPYGLFIRNIKIIENSFVSAGQSTEKVDQADNLMPQETGFDK